MKRCKKCGKQIPVARLAIFPNAPHCTSCAEDVDTPRMTAFSPRMRNVLAVPMLDAAEAAQATREVLEN